MKTIFKCVLKQLDENNLLFQVLYVDNSIFKNVSVYDNIFATDFFRIKRNGHESIGPDYISLKTVKESTVHYAKICINPGMTKWWALDCLMKWQDSLYRPWWKKILDTIGIPYSIICTSEDDVYEIRVKISL